MNTYAAKDYNFGGYVPPAKKSQVEIPKSFFSSHKPIKILTSQITTHKEMFTRSIGRSPIFNSSADAGVETEALAQPRMSFSSSSKKVLPFSLITRNHKVNKNLQGFDMPSDLYVKSKALKILNHSTYLTSNSEYSSKSRIPTIGRGFK